MSAMKVYASWDIIAMHIKNKYIARASNSTWLFASPLMYSTIS